MRGIPFSPLPWALAMAVLLGTLPAKAQQTPTPSWQGPHPKHPPAQETFAPNPPQPPPTFPQELSTTHPQVMEVPPLQPDLLPAPQPSALGKQGLSDLAPQGEGIGRRPAYLGITYDTSPGCRLPAGVRITGMVEGSPAERAGLRAEGKVKWQQALAGLLALSPAAPLAIPLVMSAGEDSGPGDIILAVDGKRTRSREEFAREMQRFRPGDVVYFSVLRRGSLVQVPVKLEKPPHPTALAQSSQTPSQGKGRKVYLY